jgi:hypothetical protein
MIVCLLQKAGWYYASPLFILLRNGMQSNTVAFAVDEQPI